jgi:hypothetical protein
MAKCQRCRGEAWICEVHTDQPEGHDEQCAGPGIPCPECNTTNPPRMPPQWMSVINAPGRPS